MFTASVLEAISFTSFSFLAKKSGTSFVEIYSMVGDYGGNEKNPAAWTLCFSDTIPLVQDQMATINRLSCPTTTAAGSKISFHVIVKNGMYLQTGSAVVSNALVKVENSIFMKKEFDKPKGDALMTGEMT